MIPSPKAIPSHFQPLCPPSPVPQTQEGRGQLQSWLGVPRAAAVAAVCPCSQKEHWERFQAVEMPCRGAWQLVDALPSAWHVLWPQLQAWPPSHGDGFPRKLCPLPAGLSRSPLTRDAISLQESREEAQQCLPPCPAVPGLLPSLPMG